MKIIITIACWLIVILTVGSLNAGTWSDYKKISEQDDVIISYRQKPANNSWFAEWKVENNGRDWVEPFVKQRTYICADGKHQNFVNKSLGPYPAGEQRKGGIRDNGVCQGSKIESVKTDIELRPVSEKIRKMWE
jgi:hypothetical protein